ncbi:MAG: hypothetical protein PX483_10055 [Nostocales cyanobacterium LE14-WE4]|nr:hypothetical protein [Anabaena sp. 49633_E8]MDJ0501180.1 hypothetical protein [Nostocales cyanobacterium LE14-WE4]
MSVGAKHLEDKLSVIAKNSSPNASPVQLSPMVVGRKKTEKISPAPCSLPLTCCVFLFSSSSC